MVDYGEIATKAKEDLIRRQNEEREKEEAARLRAELLAKQKADAKAYEERMKKEDKDYLAKLEREQQEAADRKASRRKQFEVDRAEIQRQKKAQKEIEKEVEKIRVRQEYEAMKEGEPQIPGQRKHITSETIKQSLRNAISKTPKVLDKAVIKTFTPATNVFNKQPPKKMLMQESRQLSRVANARTPYPIAGKIQKGAAINRPVNINPSYVDTLLGKGMQTSKQGKQVQQGPVDPLARLNEFIKRI